jgi:4-hydroxybenzoyl-CoA thioesterase
VSAFQQQRAIRFSDCDPAAIVFYPQYFVMFNALVEDWVSEHLGISYRQLVVERRIGLPTVRLEVDFHAVSRMGDKVLLALDVERLGRRSITLALRCSGAGGAPRMTMRQVLVTTSLDTHASIDIPADLRGAIARVHVSAVRAEPVEAHEPTATTLRPAQRERILLHRDKP